MANGKTPRVPGPKTAKAAMPKMPARLPAAPRMPIGGTPNLTARATRAPRITTPRIGP